MPLEIQQLIDYIPTMFLCWYEKESVWSAFYRRLTNGTSNTKKNFTAKIAHHTTNDRGRGRKKKIDCRMSEKRFLLCDLPSYILLYSWHNAFFERFLMNVPSIYRNDIWLNSPLNLLPSIRKGYFDFFRPFCFYAPAKKKLCTVWSKPKGRIMLHAWPFQVVLAATTTTTTAATIWIMNISLAKWFTS